MVKEELVNNLLTIVQFWLHQDILPDYFKMYRSKAVGYLYTEAVASHCMPGHPLKQPNKAMTRLSYHLAGRSARP